MATPQLVVKPETRADSIASFVGLAVQLIGWLFVLAAAVQAFGAVLAVLLGFTLVVFGRRMRRR